MTCPDEYPWRDEECLRELYVEGELTTYEIADRLGCHQTTILRWMDRHDIDRSNAALEAGLTRSSSDEPLWRDEERLRELYVEEGLSTPQISDELGCSDTTLVDWLEQFGIDRRGREEAYKNPNPPLEERFWPKVARGEPDECWEWTAAVDGDGYGHISVDGRVVKAHRVAYKLRVEDPADDFVLHHCDNPPCVNPDHLYLGGPVENARDAVERGQLPTGEDASSAKLTEEDVVEIRERLLGEETQASIADDYGVSDSAISMIAMGENWGEQ